MLLSKEIEKETEFANQIDKLCNLLNTEKNLKRKEQLLLKLEEVLAAVECHRKSVLNIYRRT